MARNLGWTYTRYADDLTFSASKKMSNEEVAHIRQHVEGELAFVRFIKGPHHALYLKLRMMLAEEPVGFD